MQGLDAPLGAVALVAALTSVASTVAGVRLRGWRPQPKAKDHQMQRPWVRVLATTSIVGAKNRHSFGYEYIHSSMADVAWPRRVCRLGQISISTSTVGSGEGRISPRGAKRREMESWSCRKYGAQ